MRLGVRCVWPVLGLLVASGARGETSVLKTRAGSPVHWTRAEITLGLDASASRRVHRLDVVHAIERAAQAWNRIPASQPRFRFTTEPERDVTIRFCRTTWQGDSVDLGHTQFDASPHDGVVTSANIELNECDHVFTPPGEKTSGPFDLQAVMTHELGHVLGLGHSNTASAIMFPNGKGMLARAPGPDDETALAVLYIGRELAPPSKAPPAPEVALQLPGPAASPTTAHAPRAPAAAAAPEVKPDGGRGVTLQVGEPTLLPPLADTPTAKRGGGKKRR
jgi:hypothetical protein